ncbi:MarR family transcriptional regulator [Streptomyces sp. WAC 05977]|nr:MarR family transcriptional regulator [Streptomyces sp. WAC 05977]
MTSPADTSIPVFQRELDPLLLMPIRLFVLCLLADTRCHEEDVLATSLRISSRVLASHADRLLAAGYLTRREGHRSLLRLTELGFERLTGHVTAFRRVACCAVDLVAAQRAGPIHRCDT